MDRITLPRISGETTLGQALDLLATTGLSGLVADLPGQTALVELGDILTAWRKGGGKRKIAAVRPGKRTVRLTPEKSSQAVLDQTRALKKVDTLLDTSSADCVIAVLGGGFAEIVTRHEALAAALRNVRRVYQCSANTRHLWLDNELDRSRKCPLDSAVCSPL